MPYRRLHATGGMADIPPQLVKITRDQLSRHLRLLPERLQRLHAGWHRAGNETIPVHRHRRSMPIEWKMCMWLEGGKTVGWRGGTAVDTVGRVCPPTTTTHPTKGQPHEKLELVKWNVCSIKGSSDDQGSLLSLGCSRTWLAE